MGGWKINSQLRKVREAYGRITGGGRGYDKLKGTGNDLAANNEADTTTLDVIKKEEEAGSGTHTPVPESAKPSATDAKAGQGGGGKKKKKGKR
jgi:hypothetical protein